MNDLFPFRPATDASGGEWVVSRLKGFAESVTSIVPSGFAAYARVYHPAYRVVGNAKEAVSWADIAKAKMKQPHRQMQWPGISGEGVNPSEDSAALESWSEGPATGSQPLEIGRELSQTLARYTETPNLCWFAVWEGFGYLKPEVYSAPQLALPGRNMFLFNAPIGAMTASFSMPDWFQSFNLCWPDDRSWCVATEIDFMSTYIAGTQAAIEEILNLSVLEAHKAEPSDGVQYKSDLINPVGI